jgi:UDP-N-acetylglucosamine 2-epimerase (non-hydrolysing)
MFTQNLSRPREPTSALVVIGTRPEAIKLASVVHQLRSTRGVKCTVVTTGQHQTVVDDVLAFFEIAPDVCLPALPGRPALTEMLSAGVARLGPILERTRADVVVVQGDTISALAGALAASLNGIVVAHVEAGLRTHDKTAPFPEEINRRLISSVADFHFAPTLEAGGNLEREGIARAAICVTGNTGIDALLFALPKARPLAIVDHFQNNFQRCLLVTVHRRESWRTGIANVADAIEQIVGEAPGTGAVVVGHPNPDLHAQLRSRFLGNTNVLVTPPMQYPELIAALKRTTTIVTDSGGLQEEAVTLGIPVVVARRSTERPEVVSSGLGDVVGTVSDAIVAATRRRLLSAGSRDAAWPTDGPFGDGQAAIRIVGELSRYFDLGEA